MYTKYVCYILNESVVGLLFFLSGGGGDTIVDQLASLLINYSTIINIDQFFT